MCFNRTISACAGGGRAGQGSRTANSNGQTCVLKGRQLIHRCLCAPLAAAKNYPPAAEPAPLSAGSRKVVRDARSIYLDVGRVSHPSSQCLDWPAMSVFPAQSCGAARRPGTSTSTCAFYQFLAGICRDKKSRIKPDAIITLDSQSSHCRRVQLLRCLDTESCQ